MLKRISAWPTVVILLVAGIPGYGYWHAHSHGSLNISIYDATADNQHVPVQDAEINLYDENRVLLATGNSSQEHGIIMLVHPVHGSCAELKNDAWQACFRIQSVWLMEWIERVRSIDVHSGECRLQLPVEVSSYIEEWWLWWIPLPHVGGTPYSYYRIIVRIDPVTCRAIG